VTHDRRRGDRPAVGSSRETVNMSAGRLSPTAGGSGWRARACFLRLRPAGPPSPLGFLPLREHTAKFPDPRRIRAFASAQPALGTQEVQLRLGRLLVRAPQLLVDVGVDRSRRLGGAVASSPNTRRRRAPARDAPLGAQVTSRSRPRGRRGPGPWPWQHSTPTAARASAQ